MRVAERRRAVIVAAQPEAVEAGAAILEAGGNAVDAAIACAFVQTVVDPLMCGIAGFGSLAAYLPQRDFHGYYDFHAAAPRAARPDMWESLVEGEARDGFGFIVTGHVNEIGYESICAPASLRALHTAHQEHGTLPWRDVLAPAIEYARDGWTVRPAVHDFWSDPGAFGHVPNSDRASFTPAAAALYLRPDGSAKRMGDVVVNRDYADVLAAIARSGPEPFYTGDLARAMVDDIAANGGHLTLEDLADVAVRRNEPLWTTYRGWSVATNRPPGGGVQLVQMLNVLENFDLEALGHNSAEYVRVVSEAMKKATADKDRYVGDPAFVDVPLDRLTSKAYARGVADQIAAGEKIAVPRHQGLVEGADTTHLSVIDADGNCVAMTHSLGLPSGVVTPGLGFMYNGCMSSFDPRPGRAASISPGKARFSSVCPSVVFDDEGPMLVIGAPGGTQIAMGVLQATLNVLDFAIPIAEAVALPRFSATSDVIDVVNRVPRAVQAGLEAAGYEVVRSPRSYGFGLVHGLARQDGRWRGGADPGGDGMALEVAAGAV